MKKFIAIFSSLAVMLCSLPTMFFAFADTVQIPDVSWITVEDFEGGKTADQIGKVDWSDAVISVGTNETGYAWEMDMVTGWTTTYTYLYDAYSLLPGDCEFDKLWITYDLKGPAAIDNAVSATDYFQFQPGLYDGTTNLRMPTTAEANINGIDVGFLYIRNNGDTEWTKLSGEENYKINNNFNGEIMYSLASFCIDLNNNKAYTTAIPNMASGSFCLRNFFSEMSKNEKIQIDNIDLGINKSTDGNENDEADNSDKDWYILQDFEAEGKSGADYTVFNGENASLMDNGEDGKAFVYTLNDTWTAPGIILHNANRLPADCNWYKYDLKGPAALDSSVSADDTFQFGIRFNDADPNGDRCLAWPEQVTDPDLAGYVYVRNKGETNWTIVTGVNTVLRNDFDGEVMVNLALLCVYTNGSYVAKPLNIHSWFSERTVYSGMVAGEKFAVDNICITNKDMTPKPSEDEIKMDGDWYILEDFNTKGKIGSDYAVFNGEQTSLIDDGAGGKAYVYTLTDNWASPGVKLYKAVNYPQNCSWYKYSLKGPKAIDPNAADGTFQISVQFNNGIETRKMAWPEQVTDPDLAGYVYVRNKGETKWTKLLGVNIELSNDFDGEIMFPLNLLCYTDKFITDPMLLNEWFSERVIYALMAPGEKYAIDNICITNKDMTPNKYKILLQGFDTELENAVENEEIRKNSAIITSTDSNRLLKITSNGEAFAPNVNLKGTTIKNAKYLDFYIEGPGGSGTFQITPYIQTENGWIGMSSVYMLFFDESLAGAVYTKGQGEEKFSMLYCGSSFSLPNDFKGVVRYELSRFNSRDGLYSRDVKLGSKFIADTSWFSFVEKGKSIVVDDYYVILDEMVSGVDFVADAKDLTEGTGNELPGEDSSQKPTTNKKPDKNYDKNAFFGNSNSSSEETNNTKSDIVPIVFIIVIIGVVIVATASTLLVIFLKKKYKKT